MTLDKALKIMHARGKGIPVSVYNEAVDFLNEYCGAAYFHKLRG